MITPIFEETEEIVEAMLSQDPYFEGKGNKTTRKADLKAALTKKVL